MPVFYILLILGVVLLWFLLPFCFKPIGRLANKLYGDAKKAMTEDDNPASEAENTNNKEEKESK
jgi:Sec-independent protein translocase protein TatA